MMLKCLFVWRLRVTLALHLCKGSFAWLQIWICLDSSPQILLAISQFLYLLRFLKMNILYWNHLKSLYRLVFVGISWLHPHLSGFIRSFPLNPREIALRPASKQCSGRPGAIAAEGDGLWWDMVGVWMFCICHFCHLCIFYAIICWHIYQFYGFMGTWRACL